MDYIDKQYKKLNIPKKVDRTTINKDKKIQAPPKIDPPKKVIDEFLKHTLFGKAAIQGEKNFARQETKEASKYFCQAIEILEKYKKKIKSSKEKVIQQLKNDCVKIGLDLDLDSDSSSTVRYFEWASRVNDQDLLVVIDEISLYLKNRQ